MREKVRSKGRYLSLILAFVVGVISFWGSGINAKAVEKEIVNPDFEMNANLVSADKDTYNIQLDIENKGADWEGTVRVLVSENYYVPSAYDTTLSLPQGSKKQFVLKVPKGSTESVGGDVKVLLLNKKSKVIAEKRFKKLLLEELDCITMGILSDAYSDLTYLDMGGTTLYYYGSNMPVKLVEINQDNLGNMLSTLTMLVIDKYNTSVLTDEQKKDISLWVDNGGLLIVGTGNYAKDTLDGLGDVLPSVSCVGVVAAGTEGNADRYYGTYNLNVANLDMAQLQVDTSQYMECYFSYGYAASRVAGAMAVLPYSLVDLGKAGDSVFVDTNQDVFVLNMLEELACYASARYSKNSAASAQLDSLSNIRRMLGILGNSNNVLNFGFLKFLVIMYVIFVGPVLYLILKFTKKREWYWVTVPATAFLGIILVFLAGRGFEVVDTKVYSVTAQDASGKREATTYLYCYDADHKEWDLQLGEKYEYAGSLMNQNYGYLDEDDYSYYHRIQNEGGRLSIGIKPSSSFEDSFFYAGQNKDSIEQVGTIEVEGVGIFGGSVDCRITNNTTKDFLYYGVVVDGSLYVYKDLKAGESATMSTELPIFTSGQGFNVYNDYIYGFIRNEHRDKKSKEDVTALSALGAGFAQAYPTSDFSAVVVCGVVEDWEPAVDDKCKEVSYGCLYVTQ